jgi:hypothetical protein
MAQAKTAGRTGARKAAGKTAPKKSVTKKTSAKKTVARKTAKKAAGMKEGSRYVCGVCGLAVTVDTACGCAGTTHLICCEKPMRAKR